MFIALLFPVNVSATAVLFAALGDPMATVIGSMFGRTRVLGKSLEGDGACLLVCIVIGVLIHIFFGLSLITALVGAVAATAVQAFSLPVNDNITIPVTGAVVMWVVNLFV